MEKEKTQIETELKKKGAASALEEKQLPNGETKPTSEAKPKSGGRRLVIQEVEEDESAEEEDVDLGKKELNTSKKTSERKDLEKETRSQARNGTSETDGSVSSKSKQQMSPHGSPNLPTTKDVPQTSNAANQEEEKEKEVTTTPTPPKPAKPLPVAVISLKDAGNDFFKKGQYVDASERYSKAINILKKGEL